MARVQGGVSVTDPLHLAANAAITALISEVNVLQAMVLSRDRQIAKLEAQVRESPAAVSKRATDGLANTLLRMSDEGKWP